MRLAATSLLVLLLGLAVARAGQYWDWQLSDPYNLNVDTKILVIELDDLSRQDVAGLKARGVMPICYISVGTWEKARPDARAFPKQVIGRRLDNWPNEKYLDIRRLDVIVPFMQARFKACADKGFVGVEPDNIDGFDNDSGFDLTRQDAVTYVLALREVASGLGLKLGQKNAPELVPDLVKSLDFMLVEECLEYDFCEDLLPYRKAGKDVLSVEFIGSGQNWSAVCQKARKLGFRVLIKDKDVHAGGQVCPN